MPQIPKKVPEPYRELARRARGAGWRITHTGSGHLAWRPPSGRVVFTPSTPSSPRGIAEVKAKLRRAGLGVS
jgi:hypothetical protein